MNDVIANAKAQGFSHITLVTCYTDHVTLCATFQGRDESLITSSFKACDSLMLFKANQRN
jgi:hypothetical protein